MNASAVLRMTGALLCLILCSVLVAAINTRTILPVTVAPLNGSGQLTPNTLYTYNFVFAATMACTPLLNVTANITTNSRGIGSAELNITALGGTPNYICEYVNGALRKKHPVFSSMFEQQTSDTDILGFGYNHTSTLDTYFIRNATIPSCTATQKLTSSGNGVLTCTEDLLGNSTTNANSLTVRSADSYLIVANGTTSNFSANLTAFDARYLGLSGIATDSSKLGGQFSSYYWNMSAALITAAQAATTLGNWSADKINYVTTTTFNSIGNWTNDKASYATSNVLTSVGNYSAGKAAYSTCNAGNYSYWNGSTLLCSPDTSGGNADGTGGWTNTSTNVSTRTDVYTTGDYYTHSTVRVMDLQTYFCDFMTAYAVTMCTPSFYGVVVGTAGASIVATGTPATPGLIAIRKGTSAGSGYTWRSDVSSILINGSEIFAAQLRVETPATGNTTVVRFGFHDQKSVTLANAVVDGVYFTINATPTGSTVSGGVANNSVRTYTSTNTSISFGAYYTYIIKIDATASSANYLIKDSTDAIVYNQTITTSLPTTTSRVCGINFIMGSTNTSAAAATIGYLDYLYAEVAAPRRPSIVI